MPKITSSSALKKIKKIYAKKKHIIDHLIITVITLALISILMTFLGSWGKEGVLKFISDAHNWLETHDTITKVIVTFCLVSFLEYRKTRKDIFDKGKIANNIGLFYSSNNEQEEARVENDTFLAKQAEQTREIWISGATGYKTFASESSPLFNAIKSAQVVKIMLLSPLSEEAIRARANDINITESEYKAEIIKSLLFLQTLKEEEPHRNIQVKLYKSYPFWKYIFLPDKYVWVQQYPYRDHVKNAPGYAFQKLKNNSCVYSHMEEQFKRRFRSERFGVYDATNDTLTYRDKVIQNICT